MRALAGCAGVAMIAAHPMSAPETTVAR